MEISLDTYLNFLWIAGISPILLASAPFSFLGPIHRLLSCLSGRGKTVAPSSKWMLPQSYFLHFYIVGVVWSAFLLVCLWRYASGVVEAEEAGRAWRPVFLLLLVELQVLRRLYESVFVFKYSSSAKMHVFAYLTGLCFYTAMPLSMSSSVACKAWGYISSNVSGNLFEGQEGMLPLKFNWREYTNHLMSMHWSQLIGATIFVWGWMHQLRCHQILGSLRKGCGKDHYAIPAGDWFEFVSSAHYLAEIVLYGGILIASGGSNPNIWLAFIFVVANLTFAAAETHRWYCQKFENYPRSRYAILPRIY